jgi:FkbM family methyltransferase
LALSASSRLIAAATRRVPAPVVRFVGRRQGTSKLWRSVGGLAKQAMSSDGVIAHGYGAGLRFNAGGGNAGYALGTSEPEVQDAFAKLTGEGQVVYDIGANAGFYTVIAAKLVGSSGRVFSFEPLPANIELIEHNIALNNFSNVTQLPFAVGPGSGHASFTLGFDNTRGGLTDQHVEPGTNGTIEVEVRSLDGLIAEGVVPPPDMIKMDIEGAEVAALNGALSTLDEHKPRLLIEIHGTGAELEPLLESHGYSCEVIDSDLRLAEAPWGMYVVATPL